MKETICTELEDAINGILAKHQDELGVTSGDIDFPQAIKFDELMDEFAELLVNILEFQKLTNGVD